MKKDQIVYWKESSTDSYMKDKIFNFLISLQEECNKEINKTKSELEKNEKYQILAREEIKKIETKINEMKKKRDYFEVNIEEHLIDEITRLNEDISGFKRQLSGLNKIISDYELEEIRKNENIKVLEEDLRELEDAIESIGGILLEKTDASFESKETYSRNAIRRELFDGIVSPLTIQGEEAKESFRKYMEAANSSIKYWQKKEVIIGKKIADVKTAIKEILTGENSATEEEMNNYTLLFQKLTEEKGKYDYFISTLTLQVERCTGWKRRIHNDFAILERSFEEIIKHFELEDPMPSKRDIEEEMVELKMSDQIFDGRISKEFHQLADVSLYKKALYESRIEYLLENALGDDGIQLQKYKDLLEEVDENYNKDLTLLLLQRLHVEENQRYLYNLSRKLMMLNLNNALKSAS